MKLEARHVDGGFVAGIEHVEPADRLDGELRRYLERPLDPLGPLALRQHQFPARQSNLDGACLAIDGKLDGRAQISLGAGIARGLNLNRCLIADKLQRNLNPTEIFFASV